MGVGLTSCGVLPKSFPDSAAGTWDGAGGLNAAINPDCFWLVDEKALPGAFPGAETVCLGVPNEKVPTGRLPGVPDEGVPELKGMFCLGLANEKALAAALEGVADVGVADEKETGCLELAKEKVLTGRFPDGPDDKKADADEAAGLAPANEKTPTGRSPEVLSADETFP